METRVQKISTLLSIFQASLYDHMIALSKNYQNSEVYVGRVPDNFLSNHIQEASKEQSNDESIKESEHDEKNSVFVLPEVDLHIQKHGKLLKSSKTCKNDLNFSFAPCQGVRKPPVELEDIEVEYEETGQIKKNMSKNKPKVLQRLGNVEIKPARFAVPVEEREEVQGSVKAAPSLYGEVISTTYSQGGDGFALHPGDLVTVLQFFHEFQLVECKWQGLKGLFPQDKIKVLARPAHSVNSSISSVISKQFLQTKTETLENSEVSKGSKLMSRLMRKAV